MARLGRAQPINTHLTSVRVFSTPTIPNGSGTGTTARTSSATGKRVAKGSGTGTNTRTSSATGKKVPKGSGSGTCTRTSSATGKRVPKGSGTGSTTRTSFAYGTHPYAFFDLFDRTDGPVGPCWGYGYPDGLLIDGNQLTITDTDFGGGAQWIDSCSSTSQFSEADIDIPGGQSQLTVRGNRSDYACYLLSAEDGYGYTLRELDGSGTASYLAYAPTTPFAGGILRLEISPSHVLTGYANGVPVITYDASSTPLTGDLVGVYLFVSSTPGVDKPFWNSWSGGDLAFNPTGSGTGLTTRLGTGSGSNAGASGVGSGTTTRTSTATGKKVPKGSGTGAVVRTSSATGKKIPKGSGTGSTVRTSSSVGKRVPKGSGTGSCVRTSSGTGKRVPKGLGTGLCTRVGSGTGTNVLPMHFGSGTGTTIRVGAGYGISGGSSGIKKTDFFYIFDSV